MFVAALAFQNLVVILGTAGMPPVVVRECVRRPQDRSQIFSTFLAVAWATSAATVLVVVCVLSLVDIGDPERALWALTTIGAAFSCGNPQPVFDTLHRQAFPAMVSAAGDVMLFVVLVVLATAFEISLLAAALLFTLKWILTTTILLRGAHSLVPFSPRKVSLAEARVLWHSGWPILIAGLAFSVPVSGATLFARWLSGAGQAALYGLAAQVLQAYVMLVVLAHQLLQPHVAGPYGFTRHFVLKLAFFYAAYLGSLALAAAAGSYLVIRSLLPADYLDAVWPCWVMTAAGLIVGIGTALNNYLLMLHYERRITISYLFGCAVFLLASMTLASPLGALGQSLAVFLAFLALAAANAVSLFMAQRAFSASRPFASVAEDALGAPPRP